MQCLCWLFSLQTLFFHTNHYNFFTSFFKVRLKNMPVLIQIFAVKQVVLFLFFPTHLQYSYDPWWAHRIIFTFTLVSQSSARFTIHLFTLELCARCSLMTEGSWAPLDQLKHGGHIYINVPASIKEHIVERDSWFLPLMCFGSHGTAAMEGTNWIPFTWN